jgi:hypothetical protein
MCMVGIDCLVTLFMVEKRQFGTSPFMPISLHINGLTIDCLGCRPLLANEKQNNRHFRAPDTVARVCLVSPRHTHCIRHMSIVV